MDLLHYASALGKIIAAAREFEELLYGGIENVNV